MDTETTQAADTAIVADSEEKQQEQKTFTQAELDAIINERLRREKAKYPKQDELDAFRKYQEEQKTEAQRHADALQALSLERDAAATERDKLQQELTALRKGVPAEKAAAYVHLAGLYLSAETPFEAALDKAIAEMPLADSKGSPRAVPGAGGNPSLPSGKPEPKNARESIYAKAEKLLETQK